MAVTKRGQLVPQAHGSEEEQWLVCCNPERMLATLALRTSERKLRLLACSWVRLLGDLLTRRGQSALEVTEKCADQEATAEDLARARLE